MSYIILIHPLKRFPNPSDFSPLANETNSRVHDVESSPTRVKRKVPGSLDTVPGSLEAVPESLARFQSRLQEVPGSLATSSDGGEQFENEMVVSEAAQVSNPVSMVPGSLETVPESLEAVPESLARFQSRLCERFQGRWQRLQMGASHSKVRWWSARPRRSRTQ